MPREANLPEVTSIEPTDLVRVVYDDSGIQTSADIQKQYLLPQYILINDTKAQASNGGTFTSGAYRTRDLNTESVDTGSNATLAANQITLLAGTYRVSITAPASDVDGHKAILYNVTDATTTLFGTSAFTSSSNFEVVSVSTVTGQFTITSSKVFEVRHQCTITKATTGFGVGNNFTGASEIFTVFEAWKQ